MSEIEVGTAPETADEAAARLESIWNLPPEVIERIPLACINCSTARLLAYRARLSRRCPGPVLEIQPDTDDTTSLAGSFAVRQLCRYPTGPTSESEAHEVIKTIVRLSSLEDGQVLRIGGNGPPNHPGPARAGDRDWSAERLKALLYVIDHQGGKFTPRHVYQETNPGQEYSSWTGRFLREWLTELEIAEGRNIVGSYKDIDRWVMYVPQDLHLVADQTLREAIGQLPES